MVVNEGLRSGYEHTKLNIARNGGFGEDFSQHLSDLDTKAGTGVGSTSVNYAALGDHQTRKSAHRPIPGPSAFRINRVPESRKYLKFSLCRRCYAAIGLEQTALSSRYEGCALASGSAASSVYGRVQVCRRVSTRREESFAPFRRPAELVVRCKC